MKSFNDSQNIPPAKLDLLIWYLRNREVNK